MVNIREVFFPKALKIDSETEKNRRIDTVNDKTSISTENELNISGFNVGHSIPGSMACLVESKDSQVLYTGDLRFHGRSSTDLGTEFAGLKPDIMICEGTRIEEQVPDDEQQVESELTKLFSRTDGLAMVGFAWKDLERYETVRDAALKSCRIPVFDPRLAYLVARIGRSVYDEGSKVFLERCGSMLYSSGDYTKSKHKVGQMPSSDWNSKCKPPIVDTKHLDKGVSAVEIRDNPNSYVLQMDFFRFKNILDLEPLKGSVFIRAQCEPFNPRMELSEERMIHWLKYFKLNEENDNQPYQIHASGHASGPEIQEMINDIMPKKLVPVHTKRPDLFRNPTCDVMIPQKGAKINFK